MIKCIKHGFGKIKYSSMQYHIFMEDNVLGCKIGHCWSGVSKVFARRATCGEMNI